MLDGQSASKLLPWLNAMPEVKKILGEDFEGLAVSDQNLSDWRNGGHQDWLLKRERIARTRELATYAAQQTSRRCQHHRRCPGDRERKTLELLETLDEVTEGQIENLESGKQRHLPADALVAIAGALGSLRTSEQNDVRLAQNEKKLKQKDEELKLAREKYQRDTAELFLKWHQDKSAADIAGSDTSNADKIERLGQLMFGETWKPAAK